MEWNNGRTASVPPPAQPHVLLLSKGLLEALLEGERGWRFFVIYFWFAAVSSFDWGYSEEEGTAGNFTLSCCGIRKGLPVAKANTSAGLKLYGNLFVIKCSILMN